MSAREVSAGGNDYRLLAPLHRGSTRDNLPQFQTWCSTDVDLGDSASAFYPEAVMGGASFDPVARAIGRILRLAIKVISICFIAVGVGALIARVSLLIF
jgi:hypothetical protein